MTAQSTISTPVDDLLLVARDPVEAARQHIAEGALTESAVGPVGLELEMHLVDLGDPARRPGWDEVRALAAALPAMPSGSPVTLEPGGQIELSTPPAADLVAAVTALRTDEQVLRSELRVAGYGAAPLGTDPARPVQRINPAARYAAMEQHFDSQGCAGAGMQMMTATAALQVNLDAGPASGWEQRLGLVRSMVPMLVAASSTSPYLAGEASGWHSMRQGVWQGIDHGRSDPMPGGEPTAAWASYALAAPVMLVRTDDGATALTERVTFAQWLQGEGPIDRRPTVADLDYHLTTLFPPVRPRGYVEIRCIDAMPDRWWPAIAATTVTLLDDPEAAELAAEICEPVDDAWETAAHEGLAAPVVRRAVEACLELAARRCPVPLRAEVEVLADLVASGSSPGDSLRARALATGPLCLLQEEAHA
jgi:glutamate--cysteine ligase